MNPNNNVIENISIGCEYDCYAYVVRQWLSLSFESRKREKKVKRNFKIKKQYQKVESNQSEQICTLSTHFCKKRSTLSSHVLAMFVFLKAF